LLFWFAGGACLLVWVLLHDPGLDYRVLIGGALLPEVLGVYAHSVLVAVAVLFVVMLVTRGAGARERRRRWLALPFGWFAHLVLDAVWTNTALFWWPASGWSLAGERLPSLTRPVWLVVVEELAGLLVLWSAFRRFGLDDGAHRAAFVRTGTVDAGAGGVTDVPTC
jgi:hypothetical protein